MTAFDEYFEASRLELMANQFKDYVQHPIEIMFLRENENCSHYRWKFSDSVPLEQRGVTDFRRLMGKLIEDFIDYRKQFDVLPNNEGIVHIDSGNLWVEWISDGGTELSN
ncbi:hypothetical protein [Thorsellia anophelis]|uniref:Uncharacterized protein n=1 Tax=Thorsellia anophelis DSM 18579 TaxID=1123402 RepID=A0A1I0FNW0_9GAMM|nr:hypothetical protein [Thorsellia anophelis]SET59946.1 hypothetical protein SAMN02583745_02831 [Thorsellia anophelis DSM 18579]